MKQALKDSYWYFYIPLVILFMLPSCAQWVLESEEKSQENYRHGLITLLCCFSAIYIFAIWYVLMAYIL